MRLPVRAGVRVRSRQWTRRSDWPPPMALLTGAVGRGIAHGLRLHVRAVSQLFLPVDHDLVARLERARQEHRARALGEVDRHRDLVDVVRGGPVLRASRPYALFPLRPLAERRVAAASAGAAVWWHPLLCRHSLLPPLCWPPLSPAVLPCACWPASGRGALRRQSCPSVPVWMAAVGTTIAFSRCFDDQPDVDELVWEQGAVRLSNTALSLAVPVVVSIWLSMVSNVPAAIFCLVVAPVGFDGQPLRRRAWPSAPAAADLPAA